MTKVIHHDKEKRQATLEIEGEALKKAIAVICDACEQAGIDRMTGHVAMKILTQGFEKDNGLTNCEIWTEDEVH